MNSNHYLNSVPVLPLPIAKMKMLSVRSIVLAGLCLVSFASNSCFAFTVQNPAVVRRSCQSNFISQEQKFSRRKTQIYYGDNNEEERKVAVFEIPNVDAATRKYFRIYYSYCNSI